MGTANDMIAQAEKALGTAGRPNYMTRWYADRNGAYFASAPWCNMAITYWAAHSDNYEAVCFGTDYAYTVWHAQRFERNGRWYRDVAGIRRGDIVFFDWGGTNSIGRIDHIGIVTSVDGGRIHTIEGNTSDRCARRVRYASQIVGYGRPAYSVPSAPTLPSGAYIVEPGDTLWGIAREHDCTVADLRKWNPGLDDLIHPGDRILLAAADEKPYSPPPFPYGLRPDVDSPSAQGLQKALKAAGYMPKNWVELSDNYGPKTQAAVIAFHRDNPEYAARYTDPVIGPRGWAHLHREAYGD